MNNIEFVQNIIKEVENNKRSSFLPKNPSSVIQSDRKKVFIIFATHLKGALRKIVQNFFAWIGVEAQNFLTTGEFGGDDW